MSRRKASARAASVILVSALSVSAVIWAAWGLLNVKSAGEVTPHAVPTPPSILQVQPPPSCDSESNPPSLLVVATEPHRLRFTSDCYYAPANTAFKVRFTNNTVAANGDTAPDNISIYTSQDKAVWYEEDGQVLRSDQSAAIFRGPEVQAPGTIEFDVPALPAGTYYIQSDLSVNSMYATLVIGG